MLIPAGLGLLVLGGQFRLKDRAAAAIVHLLAIVLALLLFIAHREAVLGAFMGLRSLVE